MLIMKNEEMLKMSFNDLIGYRTQMWEICQGKPWESQKAERAWKNHSKANHIIKLVRERITVREELDWEFLPTSVVMARAGISLR